MSICPKCRSSEHVKEENVGSKVTNDAAQCSIRTTETIENVNDLNSCLAHCKKKDEILSTKVSESTRGYSKSHQGGFVHEQHHAHTFTTDAKEKGINLKAEVTKPGNPNTDIIVKKGDEVIGEYQCKISKNPKYIDKAAKNPKYEGNDILKNSDNNGGKGLPNVTDHIDKGGAKSTPITNKEACDKNYRAPCCKKNDILSKDTAKSVGKTTIYQSGLSVVNNGIKVCKGEQSLGAAAMSVGKDTGGNLLKNTVQTISTKALVKVGGSVTKGIPFVGNALDTVFNVSKDLYQTGTISGGTIISSGVGFCLSGVCLVCPQAACAITVCSVLGSLYQTTTNSPKPTTGHRCCSHCGAEY
eukprot:Tbor_TRINITY_DN5981_c3_g1::TRINITY_DN5981_c3_g1_i2::g.19175::m.19175